MERLFTASNSLIHYRYLLKTLSVNDFRAQYLGSALGLFWTIIKPLALIAIYATVFSFVVTPANLEQGKAINFGLFIFAGMLPWLAIQESLQRGATVFVDLSHLVRHHPIPLSLLPFHIVISATVSELIAIAVFLLIKWIITQNVSLYCIIILGLIPLQVAFCFGMALMVGTLNVFLRDISPLTTTFLLVWFFTSPIVFPLDNFPIQMKRLMWANPMTSLTQLYRDLLLYDQLPSILPLALFLSFACLSLIIGYWVYRKTHKVIVDWV